MSVCSISIPDIQEQCFISQRGLYARSIDPNLSAAGASNKL